VYALTSQIIVSNILVFEQKEKNHWENFIIEIIFSIEILVKFFHIHLLEKTSNHKFYDLHIANYITRVSKKNHRDQKRSMPCFENLHDNGSTLS
jgi:hypothetical protein